MQQAAISGAHPAVQSALSTTAGAWAVSALCSFCWLTPGSLPVQPCRASAGVPLPLSAREPDLHLNHAGHAAATTGGRSSAAARGALCGAAASRAGRDAGTGWRQNGGNAGAGHACRGAGGSAAGAAAVCAAHGCAGIGAKHLPASPIGWVAPSPPAVPAGSAGLTAAWHVASVRLLCLLLEPEARILHAWCAYSTGQAPRHVVLRAPPHAPRAANLPRHHMSAGPLHPLPDEVSTHCADSLDSIDVDLGSLHLKTSRILSQPAPSGHPPLLVEAVDLSFSGAAHSLPPMCCCTCGACMLAAASGVVACVCGVALAEQNTHTHTLAAETSTRAHIIRWPSLPARPTLLRRRWSFGGAGLPAGTQRTAQCRVGLAPALAPPAAA